MNPYAGLVADLKNKLRTQNGVKRNKNFSTFSGAASLLFVRGGVRDDVFLADVQQGWCFYLYQANPAIPYLTILVKFELSLRCTPSQRNQAM